MTSPFPQRRAFLRKSVLLPGLAWLSPPLAVAKSKESSSTNGVVLIPEDLTLSDWPARAKRAGLTTIGIHHQNSPKKVMEWIRGKAGEQFLRQCKEFGLEVEYELHAMKELLPRELYNRKRELFRMNEKGERTADSNCCVHSPEALDLIAQNAVEIAKTLRPTTNRYFYWGDDGKPWCQCPKCKELSPAEQAVLIENRIVVGLLAQDKSAKLAHLAYANTLSPPLKVKPHGRLFLEYAPIHRRYDVAYESQNQPNAPDGLPMLDANLKVFPAATAQVLEYWLDVSRFSRWKKPAVQLPWREDVLRADLATYRKRGIHHITTFAAWIDSSYQAKFGNLDFINAYGKAVSTL